MVLKIGHTPRLSPDIDEGGQCEQNGIPHTPWPLRISCDAFWLVPFVPSYNESNIQTLYVQIHHRFLQ